MPSARLSLAVVSLLALAPLAVVHPGEAVERSPGVRRSTSTPELSASTRLAHRRSLVIGERMFEMGTEDGTYPALGFHTRGEMGGFWTQPIKLLDGIWFKLGREWLTAERYTNGWGYQRMDLGRHDGVHVTRTDFVPGRHRAALVGLHLASGTARTVRLTMDAHSELMKVYPWGETSPSQLRYNLKDTASTTRDTAVFREQGTPPVRNAERHSYAAVVGSTLTPRGSVTGPDFRGPQDPAVICPASGPDAPAQPDRCDDTEYGRGVGARMTYRVHVPEGGRTVWFAVAGSDQGLVEANREYAAALTHPAHALAARTAQSRSVDRRTRVSLPGDRLLARSVRWSKQNLASSVQQARDLAVRVTHAGKRYPPSKGTVSRIRWIGAGWPDYPWLFATDGEYSAFAAVAAGQFGAIEDHLRALRDVSLVANGHSGKVVHEVTPDGQVYFGANGDEGNTDETAKLASAVALVWRWTGDDGFRDEMYPAAKRGLRFIYRTLDGDGDGWPEGLGNVERPGMGEEKLDNTVYTIRGLRDLADLAASKHDGATRRWATTRARSLERRFEEAWWYGGSTDQYADSLDDPGNKQVFQRHWIGVTPVEAELTEPGWRTGPLASRPHARKVVAKREEPCYSGRFGLFHTGSGATSDPAGNKGPTCDAATSTVPAERTVFTLNTAIMANAEAALGRMGSGQLQRYTTDNAQVQLSPKVWELPGDMPEISPSPDFGANIDRRLTERSMVLQAWGTYGTLWPVVHFELGVTPDLGRDRVRVVPQVPRGQQRIAGRNIRLGHRAISVRALRGDGVARTTVRSPRRLQLVLGAVVPGRPTSVRLDGHRARYQLVRTARGREVRVAAGRQGGRSRLVVRY